MSTPGFYESLLEKRANAAAASAFGAVGPSPEKAAKSIDLGINGGVAPSVVNLNPEKFQDEAAQQRNADIVKRNTALQAYILGNPLAGSVSSDDFEALDTFTTAASVYSSMQRQSRESYTPFVGATEHPRGFGYGAPGTAPEIRRLPEAYTPFVAQPGAEERDALREQMTTGRRLIGPPLEPLEYNPSRESNVGPPILKIIGAVLKLPDTFMRTFGREMAATPLGEGMWGSEFMQEQMFTGPMGLFNKVTVGTLARTVDLFFRPFMAAGTATGEAIGEARVTLEPGAGETEKGQAARDVRALFDAILFKFGQWDIVRPRAPFRRKPVAVPEVVQTPDGPVATMSPEVVQAAIDAWSIEMLGRTVETSKTFERSKPMAESFAREVLGDEAISIPAERVQQVYVEDGLMPGDGGGPLDFIPDVWAKLVEAERAGADIVVPLSQWLVHATAETRARFAEDVRVAPERPTLNEAVEADTVRREAAEAAKPVEPTGMAPLPGEPAIPVATERPLAAVPDDLLAKVGDNLRKQLAEEPAKIPVSAEEVKILKAAGVKFADEKARIIEAPESRRILDEQDFRDYPELAAKPAEAVAAPVAAAEAAKPVGEAAARAVPAELTRAYETASKKYYEELGSRPSEEVYTDPVLGQAAKELFDADQAISDFKFNRFYEKVAEQVGDKYRAERDVAARPVGDERAVELGIQPVRRDVNIYRKSDGALVVSLSPNAPVPEVFARIVKNEEVSSAFEAATKAAEEAVAVPEGVVSIGQKGVEEFQRAVAPLEDITRGRVGESAVVSLGAERAKPIETEAAKAVPEAAAAAVPSPAPPTAAATPAARARKELFLDGMFEEPKAAGMTVEEFKVYSQRLETQRREAEFAHNLALETEVRARERARSAESVTRHTPAATEAFDTSPAVAAENFLRTNNVKIRVEEGIEVQRNIVARDGINPDSIAHALGYQTGDQLVSDLALLHSARGGKEPAVYRGERIREGAMALAEAELGPIGPRINQAVTDGLYNEATTRVLHDDMRVMRRQNEGETSPPISLEELNAWAERVFNETFTVADARSLKSAERAVQQAGRRAELALQKGRVGEAFKAKNQQLHAHMLARKIADFQKELKKAGGVIKRYSKASPPKGVAPQHVAQIQGILARHGVPIRRDAGELQRTLEGKSLERFIFEKTNAYGAEIAIAPWLFDEVNPLPINRMNVQDFREMMRSIDRIDHNGKAELKISDGEKAWELEEIVGEMRGQVQTIEAPLRFASGKSRGAAERARALRYQADASLVRPENLIWEWDKDNPLGPFHRFVLNRLRKALAHRNLLFKLVGDHLKALPPIRQGKKLVSSPFVNPMNGLPYDFNRIDVVMLALNTGNKRNMELLAHTFKGGEIKARMGPELPPPREVEPIYQEQRRMEIAAREAILGELREVSEREVMDWINSVLTADDWKFVQGVWDMFDGIWPQADAMYRRLSGEGMDKVEAVPVQTPFGVMRGGYSPIIYDRLQLPVMIDELQLFENTYNRATTPNRYTISRQEEAWHALHVQDVAGLLGLRIREQLHDIAFREALIDANKILTDKRLRSDIAKHYGPEYLETLDSWMQNMANRYNTDERQQKFWTKAMRFFRERLIAQALGLNWKVIASGNIGPVLKEIVMDPAQTMYMMRHWNRYDEFIKANSPFLRDRDVNIDRDIGEALESQLGITSRFAPTGFKGALKGDVEWQALLSEQKWRIWGVKAGMWAATKFDVMLGKITWWAQYQKALAEGHPHQDAALIAETYVHKYFGSHSRVDLPTLFQASEGFKALTMFGGYNNLVYNRERDIIRLAKRGRRRAKQGDYAGMKRDIMKGTVDALIMFMVPAAFGYMYAPDMIHEDDEGNINWGATVANGVFSQMLSTVPILREVAVASSWVTGVELGGRPSPGASALKGVLDFAEDIVKGILPDVDASNKWVQHAVNAPGYTLGLPTGDPAKAAQFIWNWTTGHDVPDTFWEGVRGFLRGETEKGASTRKRKGGRRSGASPY